MQQVIRGEFDIIITDVINTIILSLRLFIKDTILCDLPKSQTPQEKITFFTTRTSDIDFRRKKGIMVLVDSFRSLGC